LLGDKKISATPKDDSPALAAARARRLQLRSILQSTFLSNFLIGALNFAVQIVFARVLGPTVIGEYATAVVAINLMATLTSFGINHGVIALGFTSERFQNALTLVLVQIGVTLFGMFVLAGVAYVAFPEDLENLWQISLLIGLSSAVLPIAHIFNSEMESKLQYNKFSAMRLASFVVANLCAAAILYTGVRSYVLPMRDFLNSLTLVIISFLLLRQRIVVQFDKKVFHEIMSATRNIWLTNLLTLGSVRFDFALVGACVSPLTFAIYFQTRNLVAGFLAFVTYPIQSALFAYLRQHRDKLAFERLILVSGYIAIGTGVLGVFFFFAIGPDLITAVLGEKWRAGSVLLAPLAAYASASLYFEILVSIAKALNAMRAVLIARIINLGLIAVAVPAATLTMGIEGSGWATAVTTAAMAVAGAAMFWPVVLGYRKDAAFTLDAEPLAAPAGEQ
jgi:O-antigen/teichoic acid export membrane protein